MKDIKNIIVVGSGKGGVGKSTVSTNLAICLSQKKFKVGLLDADIYGPSIPRMLKINEKPKISQEKKILPFDKHGIKSMSIGNLIDEEKPIIWRGAMVVRALNQMLTDIAWGELDFLIIDLPPGTGDIQLSLSQSLSISGAVVVTTPQDISLIDVRKAINMFKRVNVEITGIIENMSFLKQGNKKIYIFGKDGGLNESRKQKIPFLGQIPILPEITTHSDLGKPVVTDKKSESFLVYDKVINNFLEYLKKDSKSNHTKITFE